MLDSNNPTNDCFTEKICAGTDLLWNPALSETPFLRANNGVSSFISQNVVFSDKIAPDWHETILYQLLMGYCRKQCVRKKSSCGCLVKIVDFIHLEPVRVKCQALRSSVHCWHPWDTVKEKTPACCQFFAHRENSVLSEIEPAFCNWSILWES